MILSRAPPQLVDHDVMLVGRSEGYLIGRTELAATIDRLVAYAEAGADCLYAPGITDLAAIRTLVSAVAPKPVNVLLIGPTCGLRIWPMPASDE